MCPEKRNDPMDASVDAPAAGEAPVVLVAEDDVLVRMGISDFLRLNGFIVLEAATVTEAKALFLAGRPIDLVFSDINLGLPSDGVELALWTGARHPEIPIVMTSAGAGAYRAAALACAGVRRFLAKPYDYAEVETVLRALLRVSGKGAPGNPAGAV